MKNGMANNVDPDEKARYEPSYLDLHCLHRYSFWSAGLKGFFLVLPENITDTNKNSLVKD